VESSLLRAELFAAQSKPAEATATLDALLSKLAPEYWRRREILMLRLDLAGGSDERDRLIAEARGKWQAPDGKTEAHALTLTDVLEASHRGSEALTLLREATAALPESGALESRLLDLWEKTGVDNEALKWLQALFKKRPDRADLRLREVRWLFTTNESKPAHDAFTALLKSLPVEQQVERSVETARWLRRRNQLTDASLLLEGTLKIAPERWDLRRELGELYFAQRRNDEAARLFSGAWSKDLALDARLEVAQFLMTKHLWMEARSLLEPWLVQQPGSFEGQMLMARISDKLGEDALVERTLDKARALCDTEARYQAWLEGALEYADARELVPVWVEMEAARLMPAVGSPWTEVNYSRAMALLEQSGVQDAEAQMEVLLSRLLADATLPPEKKLEVEKLKLDMLAADANRARDVEEGLQKLMEKDAAHREDYRVRLALLYQKSQRQDLAYQILEKLDPTQCTDVAGLRGVIPVCHEQGLMTQSLACAGRLTELEPAERSHWAQWLGLLAQDGQESRLRVALREVMGKAHDWQLKEEVLALLRTHLVASQWRTVLAEMTGDKPDWAAARLSAADLQSMELTTEQSRWVTWLVAYFSGKLKDEPAVAEARTVFNKMDPKQWIAFPDGLELSVSEGIESLQPDLSKPAPSQNTPGPMPGFEMRWGFALDEGRLITKVVDAQNGSLAFIADNRQMLYAIDLQSGKLRWSQSTTAGNRGPRKKSPVTKTRLTGMMSARYNNGQPEFTMPLEMVTDGTRVCYLSGTEIVCVQAATGDLLWKSTLSADDIAGQPEFVAPQTRLARADDRVVVWRPSSGRVFALNLVSGKMQWQAEVPMPPQTNNAANPWGGNDGYSKLRSSLSVSGDRIFVASRTAALLDAKDGSVRWRLATGDLPGFPIDLSSSEESSAISPMAPVPQRFIVSRSIRGGMLRLTGSNNYRGGGGGIPFASQRWAYGNTLRAGLAGYYGCHAILRGNETWVVTMNEGAMVSVMGIPISAQSVSGTTIGFAGDALISAAGSTIYATSTRNSGRMDVLFRDWASSTTASAAPDNVTTAVCGRRVYATNDKRMRAVDARSGSLLFDAAIPAELLRWVESLEKKPATSLMAGYANPMGGSAFQGSRRSYMPQGIFVQDDRGGGTLCDTRALVSGNAWIFPVSESAIACVSGQMMEADTNANASAQTVKTP